MVFHWKMVAPRVHNRSTANTAKPANAAIAAISSFTQHQRNCDSVIPKI